VLAFLGMAGARVHANATAPSVRVEAGEIRRAIAARATVVPESETAHVAATGAARVSAVHVQVGDHVERDALLASLEPIGGSNPFDVLGEGEELRAPIAGTVLSRAIEVGDVLSPLVPPMEPLFELADTSHVVLRIEIEERDASDVAVGAHVRVGDRETTITRLSPRLERRAHPLDDVASRASSEVRLAWAALPEGATPLVGARVIVEIDQAPVQAEARLPREAVTVEDGRATVRVRDGLSVEVRHPRFGACDDENVEVLGLAPGTEVLLRP
jgi:multidrug efflux pump subunit AcrA (membrane-fusion protein)